MRASHLLNVAAVAVLSACTLAPHYERPESGLGTAVHAWPTGPAYAANGTPAANAPLAADIGWQDFFLDPQLRAAVGLALEHNRDLHIAVLNVAAAQAQYRIQRSDLFPRIGATAADTVQHVSSRALGPSGQAIAGGTFRAFSAGIGFTSYEIDFFGRIRSLNEAALQRFFEQAENRRTAQISLVTEVANSYIAYLADVELLKLAQNTQANQQQAFDLTHQSFAAGVATALDLNQAEQSLDAAEADVAQFTRNVAQDRNLLRLLLGTAPPAALLDAKTTLAGERLLDALPADLPSSLLTQRPDIRAAEHELRAANANIGAARAAFFPSVSLTGSFGTASSQLSGLFGNNSEQWTFAPSISIPIFAGGANKANLDLAHIEKNVAIAQYQKTIQTAFREVADALAARGTLDAELAARSRLAAAAQTSYDLALQRFRQGVDNYLNVLDAQRTLYQAQKSVISTRMAQLQSRITLYTALGGGWRAATATTTTPGTTPSD